MTIEITEVGVVEPVTVTEFKEWANISHTDHDDLITRLITGARQRLEKYLGVAMIEKTIVLYVGLEDEYELPYGPVRSVEAVNSVDWDNTLTVLDVDDEYYLKGTGFQKIKSYTTGVHKVEYTVGYAEVPEDLKEAIMSEVAYRYEHRGDELKGKLSEEALDLAFPYKRMRV